MKCVVTCLDDDMKTRVLATHEVFDAVHTAIKYGASVANERVASVVPVPTDAEHAAEFIFEHVVEKHPHLIEMGDPEELKAELRFEIAGDIMAVFAPGNEIASAFIKADILDFWNELERLILEV